MKKLMEKRGSLEGWKRILGNTSKDAKDVREINQTEEKGGTITSVASLCIFGENIS